MNTFSQTAINQIQEYLFFNHIDFSVHGKWQDYEQGKAEIKLP